MSTRERILVLTRAIPEKSNKHGHLVCVAGITEKGEWRRLYPFKFHYGKGLIDFGKGDALEAELAPPDHDQRKESRKVLSYKVAGQADYRAALKQISPLATSLEKLKESDASLGIVKPREDFKADVVVNDTKLHDEQTYLAATEEFLEKREKVKLPVELRYRFFCKGEPTCRGHHIMLLDWELNELARNILKKDKDKRKAEQKILEKFVGFMKGRDLYFVMGTHFKYKTWIIIGVFYPEKNILAQRTLAQ